LPNTDKSRISIGRFCFNFPLCILQWGQTTSSSKNRSFRIILFSSSTKLSTVVLGKFSNLSRYKSIPVTSYICNSLYINPLKSRRAKSQGRSAERISTKKEENKTTTTTKTTVESTALLAAIKTYCTQLVTYNQNRPATKDALFNTIRTRFKESPQLAEEVFKLLTTRGAIKISENKVSYNDHKIKELLTQE
jgi:hypothetical protein